MSGSIIVVYQQEPNFPATDQRPDALRYYVGPYWVDAVGGQPTFDEVMAFVTPSPVPQSVHMWQAKAALQAAGKLDAANAAVSGSGNQSIIMAWEWAPEIARNSPAVAAMGAAIGLASADIDQLFISADAISV